MKLIDTFYLLRTASSVASVFLNKCGVRISPNWFTILSGAFFVLALFLAFAGNYLSIPLIIVSRFFDFLDGEYARLTGQTSQVGRVFDELSDTAKIPLLMVVYFYSSTSPILSIMIASLWMTFLRLKLLVKNIELRSNTSAKKVTTQQANIFRRAIAAVPQLYYANVEIFMIYLIASGNHLAGWIFAILIFYNVSRILKKYLVLVLK